MEKEKPRFKRPVTKKKQLELDLAHISREMYKRNAELAETNQTLSLLRAIDSLVLDSQEELDTLSHNIAAAIIDHSTFPLVAILTNEPRSEYLELMGWATTYKLPKNETTYRLKLGDFGKWVDGATADKIGVLKISDLTDQKIAKIFRIDGEQVLALKQALPVGTIILVKLLAHGRLVGVMLVGYTEATKALSEKEKAVLERLGDAVGIAVDNRLLFEENQRVLKQLRTANEKLKALDATKDEFISMASHQLRTPLTAVKGYLSMVLEGDVGKVEPGQQKLLDQAFTSAQRMVYLIADLLNVSRLKTGKFIIESNPCNLAEIVQGEVDQLKETAVSRGLTLTYTKPDNFPDLMLDETKTRQVAMNFIDNAIYYTQSGGHVAVKLEDKGKSVEYTVTDDGIGVPKSEQHQLFTKFYRAGNAKKARPDGTGLGLFMAKKVIVAQGGSIIFSSTEGKGSVFGFAFNKAKLQVPSQKAQDGDK